MSQPLPDPRMDVRSGESDSSDEEEDDLFATFESEKKPKDSEERTVNTISCHTKALNKGSKKSRKRTQRKEFVCKECQPIRCFKKAKVLDRHKEVVHKELCPSDSVCLWCAKQFHSQNQLLVHQKLYSHDKPLD